MIMIAVLHGILLMVILPMLLPLISGLYYYFKIRKCDPMLTTQILPLTKKDASLCFWSYFWFSNTLFCHASLLQGQEFWILLLTKKDASSCFWSCFWFIHTLFCHASPDIFHAKDKNFEFYNSFPTFWGKKWNLLFICHYSQLLFTITIHLLLFTLNFCLFKGGCPLYLK